MNLKTALALTKGGRLRLLWSVTSLFAPFYRMSFVASAAACGLLETLAKEPRSFEALAEDFAPDPSSHAGLRAWLDLGVRLGELAERPDGYRLAGYLSRKLADPANDEVAALVQEVVTFHHRLIVESPKRLRDARPWTLTEHDGALIARSSRIMEPFVFQIIDWALPTNATRLLEIGCGAGTYLRYAAEQNLELRAVGVEMDPTVAAATARAIADWGLAERITIESGDVRQRASDESFDAVTLYNVIYYFPVAERVALFAKLASFLQPGGRLIVSTSCQGGSPGMQMLDVWTSSAEGLGRLPTEEELGNQLRDAGFVDVQSKKAIPGEPYFAFVAIKPFHTRL